MALVCTFRSCLIIGLPCPSNKDIDEKTILSRLSSHTYWPFNNEAQWDLAKSCLFPQPKSKSEIESFAVEKNCKWIISGTGFESYNDFQKRQRNIGERGPKWTSAYVRPSPTASAWAPYNVEFWMRDSMDVLKEIVADTRLANHMKWAPEKLFNDKNQRLYTDLYSADLWWEKQVPFSNFQFFLRFCSEDTWADHPRKRWRGIGPMNLEIIQSQSLSFQLF
jgi:Plavaka transposase